MPRRLVFSALVVFLFFLGACAPEEEDDSGAISDAVAIDLIVEVDDYFGFSQDAKIGDIWFSDSVGLVGTPVEVVVQIDSDDFDRFKDQDLLGTITLLNTDAIKLDDFVFEFIVNNDREEFTFLTPQVKTVPCVLAFDVILAAVNPNDETEFFEANLEYQFLTNQGTPAT